MKTFQSDKGKHKNKDSLAGFRNWVVSFYQIIFDGNDFPWLFNEKYLSHCHRI